MYVYVCIYIYREARHTSIHVSSYLYISVRIALCVSLPTPDSRATMPRV